MGKKRALGYSLTKAKWILNGYLSLSLSLSPSLPPPLFLLLSLYSVTVLTLKILLDYSNSVALGKYHSGQSFVEPGLGQLGMGRRKGKTKNRNKHVIIAIVTCKGRTPVTVVRSPAYELKQLRFKSWSWLLYVTFSA